MRTPALLVPVLGAVLAQTIALPKPADYGAVDPSDGETNLNLALKGESVSATAGVCTLPYNTGNLQTAADTWEKSGANGFLISWLLEKGKRDLEHWSSRFIQDTTGNGEGGSSIDCKNFPAGNTCNPPPAGSCSNYNPPAAFFVQVSMSRCFSMFLQMHEALQDFAIEQLGSGIKDIVTDFAPPKADNQLLAMLSGGLVSAAALAGPLWKAASPLNFAVGILGVVVSGINSSPPELDANDELERQLGKVFGRVQEGITYQVNNIFSGYSLETPFLGEFFAVAKTWGAFSDGKFLDSKIVNESANKWKQGVTHRITQGLAVNALKHDGWIVFIDTAKKNKGSCKDVFGAEWIGEECLMLAKRSDVGGGDLFTRPEDMITIMKEDMVKKLSDSSHKYKFNMVEFFSNAKDCNGGDPAFDTPGHDGDAKLPRCFVNFEIKKADTSPF
ncbi:hypothetical protein AJ80_02307 [Polytolypa hystricis UAMH7299]|uniref:Ecp2 effector protein domain-containing protein n=1 Tax=Polytolypa hystricis (strain UAMH7299) TaxID=1447883 RepID=A0A2B7YRL6_POLH7|nr:hypothetical protein AJ80_02307 [Polytolypa hystricis UAMH7299]